MRASNGISGRRVLLGFFIVVLATMGIMLLSIYAGDGPMWADEDALEAPEGSAGVASASGQAGAGAASPPSAGPPYRIHVGIRCQAGGPRVISVAADGVALERAEVACTPELPATPQHTLWFERGESAFVLEVLDDTGEHRAAYEVFPSAETWVTVSHRVLDGAGFATTFETAFEAAW
jgi:hypothetical protein